MSEQAAQEPTMEEILASIRRIISEDDAPAETGAATVDEEDDGGFETELAADGPVVEPTFETAVVEEREEILELTQRYEEPAPAVEPEPEPEAMFEPAPAPAPEPIVEPEPEPAPFETVGDLDISERSEETPEPPRYASPPPAEVQPMNTLVSERAAAAAASAFSQLSQTVSPPADGRSLEDVVRELMRPMLKDWLDANLPKIVEAEVRAEVDRIVRLGGR